MKKQMAVFSFILGCLLMPWAQAAELKVGVVNVPRILEESPQAATARDALQREFEPRERKLLDMQKAIRQGEERLDRDGLIMNETEKSKLQRDLLNQKRDFQRDQEAFRDDLNLKRTELLDSLQRQLMDSIRTFAEKKGYDILLAEGVVYVKDAYNVTDQVLEHLKAGKP